MRIAIISAGAAGMYCGSCLHDNTLAAELLELGEEVVLIPTYTPLRTDEPSVSNHRVFFGGINVYLQQKLALFRHTPWWLDRVLDHPALLGGLASRTGSVDPSQLGGLTCSMLRGEAGYQRKELRKLTHWLLQEVKPDVIHLSNSMLIGVARMFTHGCGPPVVCSLSGEDSFLEKLVSPHYEEARQLLRERANDVNAFTCLNGYYAEHMAKYLEVERQKIHVIPHGLRLEGHDTRREKVASETRIIGFLARICEDKGLHLLVEACELLAKRDDLPPFELHAAGYLGIAERTYLRRLERRIADGPLAGRFTYHGEVNRSDKIRFLQSLDLLSVPTVFPEAKGLPILEALANGVPVVLPAHGSFRELVDDTGGGLHCEPHNPEDLAKKIAVLLIDPAHGSKLGLKGQAVIRDRYHARRMAEQTLGLYRELSGKKSRE